MKLTKKKFNKYFSNFLTPERIFICLASVYGLLMIALMPVKLTPDEPVHMFRAYQVSEGRLTSINQGEDRTGGYIPKSMLSAYKSIPIRTALTDGQSQRLPRFLRPNQKMNLKDVVFEDFSPSAQYSPLVYLPQALGVYIAKNVYPTLGFLTVMGKIMNLMVYVFLVWLAIRSAKHSKWVYVSAGLFPVAVQQAASLTVDVMLMGGAFLFTAILHNLFLEKANATNPNHETNLIW